MSPFSPTTPAAPSASQGVPHIPTMIIPGAETPFKDDIKDAYNAACGAIMTEKSHAQTARSRFQTERSSVTTERSVVYVITDQTARSSSHVLQPAQLPTQIAERELFPLQKRASLCALASISDWIRAMQQSDNE